MLLLTPRRYHALLTSAYAVSFFLIYNGLPQSCFVLSRNEKKAHPTSHPEVLTIVKYLLYDLAEDNFYNIWQIIVCLVVRRAVGRFEIRGIFSLPPVDNF